MPHHKGRKRMHLGWLILKDSYNFLTFFKELVSLSKVGIDIKEKMVGQLKNAWNSISNFNIPRIGSSGSNLVAFEQCSSIQTSTLIQSHQENLNENKNNDSEKMSSNESLSQTDSELIHQVNLGKINQGRRIDYVLQESPFESFNEYLFAFAAHLCYW